MDEHQKVEQLRSLANSTGDSQVREQIENAITALQHPDKVRILTATINNLRKARHLQLSTILGELAFTRYPDNAFLLAALTTSLIHTRRGNEVIAFIEPFLARVSPESLSGNDIAHLTINLSSGYKGIGNLAKAINLLEGLTAKPENVTRTLIELYCNAGAYEKAIELARTQGHLNFVSAKWYAKALFATGQREEALKVTEPFKDVLEIQKLRSEFRSDPNLVGVAAVTNPNNKVFVVHGHDTASREQLELVLHRLGLYPFVLANTSGGGLTIIEALEREISKHPDAARFGVVLLTPDDMGYSVLDGPTAAQFCARQNVVLEMGMLIAELGRSNVAILRRGNVEIPSDASGILYLSFTNHVREVVPKLVERLQLAGFDIAPTSIVNASA